MMICFFLHFSIKKLFVMDMIYFGYFLLKRKTVGARYQHFMELLDVTFDTMQK